ncbi:MAG: DUF3990 domain-containing protein [Fibrobacter sp.]|nr:DUF3990 domain-containing protein [Fibrobacter sp.]MBO7551718.1 DUF3990 domain-containing protein [Fibrobacter sp.]
MKLYHGSIQIVEKPEIRISRFNKDFYFGFYCTSIEEQAIRWATRFGSGYINVYEYVENANLKILRFEKMTDEWLDFIVACRSGKVHDYDIVEGPMADDTIFNYVQSFIDGQITREAFWNLAKFKYPTHQICFNTEKALATLTFNSARAVHE